MCYVNDDDCEQFIYDEVQAGITSEKLWNKMRQIVN